MNIERPTYRPKEDLEPGFADAVAELWFQAALKLPSAHALHDFEVVSARQKLERRLPADPAAGRNLSEAILEQAGLPDKPAFHR